MFDPKPAGIDPISRSIDPIFYQRSGKQGNIALKYALSFMNIRIIPALVLTTCVSCGTRNDTNIIVTKHRAELRIQVNIKKNWETIVNYDQKFSGRSIPQQQQDSFVARILDSLNQRADLLTRKH